MAYDIVRGDRVDSDLEVIFDFLLLSAEEFGEDKTSAFALAERRIMEIEADMRNLTSAPHQGTIRPHLGRGIRNVTKGRAIFYFDVDDSLQIIRVLAVFFGGQDHDARILLRLLNSD